MKKAVYILFLILFFICIVANKCLAQALFFDNLTIKEGLSHNTVYAVSQDKSGFMWLGLQNGLLRYDGYGFRTFPKVKDKKSAEINIRSVHALHLDSREKLWIGTDSDGLILMDTKTENWTQILDFQQIKTRINSVFEDKNGNFWIATMGNGCFVLDKNYKEIQHFTTDNGVLKNNNIFDFAQSEDNKIWIAAADTGVYIYDVSENKFQSIQSDISPSENLFSFSKCLFLDKNNQLWIGTEGDGLYVMSTQNRHFTHYKKNTAHDIPSNSISDICMMSDGKIWLSSDGDGLLECEPSTMTFFQKNHAFNFYNSLNTNNLLKIFRDKDDNVWLATFNGGVNIYKKYKTYFLNLKEWTKQNVELSNRSVLSICELKNGQIYFGTDGGGLNIWDKNNQTWQTLKAKNQASSFPSGNVVKSILEDKKGNIWSGYFGKGLDCFSPSSRRNRHFKKNVYDINALSGENIWSLAEDREGNILIGTLDGGLNVFDPKTSKITRYLHDPNVPTSIVENSVFCVLPDENDKIWLGTQNNGLELFDTKTGIFTHFRSEKNTESISANDIRCLYKDRKNRLWIGTESGGLNQWLGDGKFKRYNTENGFLNNAIMGITEDENGVLWLSSFQGISKFDADKTQLFNYDFHIAARSNQFNQMAATPLRDGSLCFGGINGVHFIQPNQMVENTSSPNVFISDFKVFNHSVSPNDETQILTQSLAETKEIHLDYEQNLFVFEFSALDYNNPSELKYAYQLEGFDKDWRYTDRDERSVSYNSLSHGTYIFKVKTTNNQGIWSDKITEIKVIIHPPFWKTLWFRTLIFLALFALAVWAFRLYTQRREEQLRAEIVEQEKQILSLQNEKLVNEVEGKNTELMSRALQMGHKNEVMQKLKEELAALRKTLEDSNLKKIKTIENIVNFELQDEDSWQQLNVYFDQVNHNFTKRILKAFPQLTLNDIRVCILIKLNLSVKEMASLLNVSVPGIEKSKYRLKKRLNLSVEDDLNAFINAF